MKIVIIGPGAMGSLFAAYLSKAKEEIWLLDKNPERAKKIQEQGISVEGISGSWNEKVNITSDLNSIGQADLIIIAVKSYDTRDALKNIGPLLSDATLILTLQNGLGNIEIISETVEPERVLAGITNQGVTLIDASHIRHAGRGETVIGRLDGKIPVQLRYLRELFNKVGLQARISRDIKVLLWSKLIINVGINALTAITRLNNGRMVEFENLRKILEEAVGEAVRVAKKKRIKLLYDDPLSKVASVCQATAPNVSSMLQDVLKSKRTEIDFINGVIVRQAQALNIPAPVNFVLTNLIKAMEASYNLKVSP